MAVTSASAIGALIQHSVSLLAGLCISLYVYWALGSWLQAGFVFDASWLVEAVVPVAANTLSC